jgi:23S rRNA pseudouridine1911/1915/1917 synthase
VSETAAPGQGAEPGPGPGEPPRVLYDDDRLAVVAKPPGLLVHRAPGNPEESLVEALGSFLGGGEDPSRPGIVHRLDRDTSGLLVVARDAEAHARLSAMIAAREVKREYVAMVAGLPPSRTGTIDAPLGRDHRAPGRVVVGGRRPRHAVTHFEVVEKLPRDSLLAVELETGRTHQIRVHLASIGHPVSGDPQYGEARRHGLGRQFLHAGRLSLAHPFSSEPIVIESGLPGDLATVLEALRESQ